MKTSSDDVPSIRRARPQSGRDGVPADLLVRAPDPRSPSSSAGRRRAGVRRRHASGPPSVPSSRTSGASCWRWSWRTAAAPRAAADRRQRSGRHRGPPVRAGHRGAPARPVGVAAATILWSIAMLAADRLRPGARARRAESGIGWGQGLFVGGHADARAHPGTSRSGVTITAGLFGGLDRATAARFRSCSASRHRRRGRDSSCSTSPAPVSPRNTRGRYSWPRRWRS